MHQTQITKIDSGTDDFTTVFECVQSRMQMAWRSIKSGSQYVAGIGTVGLSMFVLYPQLWGLKRYKNMMQMYRDGEPEPVDEDSKRIGQKVWQNKLWNLVSCILVFYIYIY